MDPIERQAAIDAFDCTNELIVSGEANARNVVNYINKVVSKIKDLPSAQPEIIRCKDCKHSEHWYKDKRRCFLWYETGIDVFEDGYCNYAERRTDGSD